jgi:hypothetical protein
MIDQPQIIEEGTGSEIKGVGILRYPEGNCAAKMQAEEFAPHIRQGVTILLPSRVDENGYYLWDFRIENGDPRQVKVGRAQQAPSPRCTKCGICAYCGT